MKRSCRSAVLLGLILVVSGSGPLGCQREEGALETAGKKAGELLQNSEDAARDAADKVKE